MKILVVSQYFWPENFRINDLVTSFIERGNDVTVLTGQPNYPSGKIFPEFRANQSHYSNYQGAKIVRVPLIPRGKGVIRLVLNYLTFMLSAIMFGSWRLRGKNFDVIFVFQPSPVTVGVPAIFFRWLKQVPVVFWVLDLWPETLEALGVVRSPILLNLVKSLVKFIYKRCDLILAQSKSFIPQIKKYCCAHKQVEYFPSWSDIEFNFSMVDLATEVPINKGSFNIMFAGNIGDAQDFPAILDAAEILIKKPVRWLIVGDGRAADWVRSEVIKRNLSNVFFMLGHYSLERMPSFYKHADILLLSLKDSPVFSMTIPGKLQSYLAAGIPILAMLNGEGANIVEEFGAGLSTMAGNGGALADAVMKLANKSHEERKEMGARGLAASVTEFDKEILVSRLLVWLNKLNT